MTGPLTVTGNHTNSAKISLSAGALDVIGSYTQASAGVLSFVISGTGAGTGFGQLVGSSSVTLGGTLNVSNAASFTPATGSSYVLVTGSPVSGSFTTTNVGSYNLTVDAAKVRVAA